MLQHPLWRPPVGVLMLLLSLWGDPAAGMDGKPGHRISPDFEPWGAEDKSAEDDLPRIPEPMVFDLMRPLGARRGEFEANALGLFPLAKHAASSGPPDALGLPGQQVEWAPELEYAVIDGLALELELPFTDGNLAACKGGAQWTFGKAFGDTFIHGAQLIIQYDRKPANWLPTLTYVAGLRLNQVWSVLGMFGLRGLTRAERPGDQLEGIMNLSVFADVAQHVTLGLETNIAESLAGQTSLAGHAAVTLGND